MHTRFNLLLQLVLSLLFGLAQADPVYTWIDHAGTTHFSQTPPADPSTDTRVLELPPPGPYDPPEDDYYSVANQAARMEARRLEAEKLRAEAEMLRAQAAAAESPPVSEPPAAPQYFYPYPYPVYRYPHRDWRWPHHEPHHRPAPMPYHSERPVTTPHFPANPQPRRKYYDYQRR